MKYDCAFGYKTPGSIAERLLQNIANELAEVNTHLKNLENLGMSMPRIKSFSIPDMPPAAEESPYASDLIAAWKKPIQLQETDIIIIRFQIEPGPVTTYIGPSSRVLQKVETTFPEGERIPCFATIDTAKEWFYKWNRPREGEIVTIV